MSKKYIEHYGTFDITKMEADPMSYRVYLIIWQILIPKILEIISNKVRRFLLLMCSTAKKPKFDAYYQAIKTNQITQKYLYLQKQIKDSP